MFKTVFAFALVAVVSCDVSHLFNKPNYNFRAPIRPVVPVYKPQPVYQPQPAYQPQRNYVHSEQSGILRQESNIHPDGSYDFAYETQNGIAANEQASIRHLGPETAAKTAQGSYQFTSPEGQVVHISYVADENGYQPVGDAIPTPHPIPEAIQRALRYIESQPAQPIQQSQNIYRPFRH